MILIVCSPMESAKKDVELAVTSAAIGGLYKTVELNKKFDSTFPHIEDCASFISLSSNALPK